MPLPKPQAGEEQDDFIERCMGDEQALTDFPDNDQRLGACHTLWDDKEKKTMKREERAFDFTDVEVRTDNDAPSIRGYAAVFDKLSENMWGMREKIAAGAFAKTIKNDDIRALLNHNPDNVLGRTKNRTLTLEEDQKGLLVEIQPPDTQSARDAMELIKRGDISQMSFGFETVKDEWDETNREKVIRTLREVKLFDVSPVTFPAYPQTSVKVRDMFAEVGLDYDALSGIFTRQERGLTLTNVDHQTIQASIELLTSYLPEPVSSGDDAPVRRLRLESIEHSLRIIS